MSDKPSIHFCELSASAKDFVHELNDPSILRNQQMPPAASIEIRKHQVERLKANIEVLVTKREEFNRKMEDYIQNLNSLIRSIEKRILTDGDKLGDGVAELAGSATRVRCLGCGKEVEFEGVQILFARESEDSFTRPTNVYVLDNGQIRKGHFSCQSCGDESLVIRAS